MRYIVGCILLLLITPAANAECQGHIRFVIEPTFAVPASQVSPYVSGLENCDGETVYFRQGDCSGQNVSSCTISGGGCEGNSFVVPESSGAHTYYACMSGKEMSLIYVVGNSSLPEFSWTGMVQIMLIASIALLLGKNRNA